MNGELPMLEARFLAHIDVERGLSAATKSSTSFDVMDAALAIPCSPSQRTYWSMSFSYACTVADQDEPGGVA